MKKLFLVTRMDLSPGQQAVQAAHSMREYASAYPEAEMEWYRTSNTLALLAARDADDLEALLTEAESVGLSAAPFREPDRGNELTAVAFGPEARKMLSRLPTALRCTVVG